jgi:hypothetical protein
MSGEGRGVATGRIRLMLSATAAYNSVLIESISTLADRTKFLL